MPEGQNAKNGDGFEEIARGLRESVGRRIREEAADDEELTHLLRLRRRSLADAVRTAMHRGDRITMQVAGLVLDYPAFAVGQDFVTLADGMRFIDVRLAVAAIRITPSRHGGSSGRPQAATFRARLAEHEQETHAVEIYMVTGESTTGSLEVVASDHVVVREPSGLLSYLPTGTIAVVFSPFPPRIDRIPQPNPRLPGPPDGRG